MAPTARITTLLITALAALAATTVSAGPASAGSGYRYWGYYHLTDGQWQASKKGAEGFTAQDGDVEGFRYATTTGAMPERPPRAAPTFGDICAGTDAAHSEKRIGVVLDYGTPKDSPGDDTPAPPEATCAVVPQDATTQQALESVEPLRIENGLVCAIDGYPASGCAVQVANVSVPRTEKPVDVALPSESGRQPGGDAEGAADAGGAAGGDPWPLVGVGALVVVLGGGAVVLARRRA